MKALGVILFASIALLLGYEGVAVIALFCAVMVACLA
jgi:hypothetical protein